MSRENFAVKKDKLKHRVLEMYEMLCQMKDMSIKSLYKNDKDLSLQAIEFDKQIDATHLKIEENCVKLLATDQPVASDLRFVISTLKIVERLERIGDYYKHISRTVAKIDDVTLNMILPLVEVTINRSEAMLESCMEAYFDNRVIELKTLKDSDSFTDDIYNNFNKKISDLLKIHPEDLDYFSLFYLSRALHRITENIFNISEYIYYIEKGVYLDLNKE